MPGSHAGYRARVKYCILAFSMAALLPRLAFAQSSAEELLARMSLEERAGQLLVS